MRKGSNVEKSNATLCGMHIKTPCTVGFKERGRKVEGVKILRVSSESQYRVSNQCELARVRNLFLSLALKLGNPEAKTQGGAGFVIPMNKS